MTDTPNELEPCPFCGGPGDEVGPSLGCSRWRIICDDCGAEGPAHGTEQANADYVPSEAKAAWNTRPIIEAQQAEIARLKGALERIASDTSYVGVPIDTEAANHFAMMVQEWQGIACAALEGES